MTIPDPLHPIDPLQGVNRQPSPASRPPESPEANIPSSAELSKEEVCRMYAKSAQALHAVPILATLQCCSEGPLKEFEMNAFFAYHRRTLEAAGAPTDPIEVMMIEQILLANQRLVALQRRAMKAQALQEMEVYNTQAIRLMAEFRKTAAGLQEYRNARAPRQVIVQQQNYAAGNQQVALLDGSGMLAGEHLLGGKMSPANIKLENSLPQGALAYDQPESAFVVPESQADPGRTPEPAETRTVHPGGAQPSTGGSDAESSVAACDGTANTGRKKPLRRQRTKKAKGKRVGAPAPRRGSRGRRAD